MAQQQKSGAGSRHVRDVMTADPDCVTERDSILDAARIMRDSNTGIVPVVAGRKVIGLITDRDIVVRGIADGKDIRNVRVNEIMTKQVRSVQQDSPIDEVFNLMSSAEIRRVPVVNTSDELVGIVSIGDLASRTDQDDKVGKAVEQISEAPPNN